MKKTQNFAVFILKFKEAYSLKKTVFLNINFLGFDKILDELYAEGFISGYCYEGNKKKIIKIFMKYDNYGKSLFFYSKVISTPGLNVFLTLGKVKNLQKEIFSCHFLRTANCGIVTQKTALKFRSGGQYLAKIK